jgi:hypothetical protein
MNMSKPINLEVERMARVDLAERVGRCVLTARKISYSVEPTSMIEGEYTRFTVRRIRDFNGEFQGPDLLGADPYYGSVSDSWSVGSGRR